MENSDHRASTSASAISNTATRYIKLLLEDTRLNIAEKLTRLISAITVCALLLVFLIVALLFASLAAGYALSPYTGHLGAFLIVAAFYVLLAVVLISCKRVFIVNPIARVISRLMLQAPTQEQANDKPASVS